MKLKNLNKSQNIRALSYRRKICHNEILGTRNLLNLCSSGLYIMPRHEAWARSLGIVQLLCAKKKKLEPDYLIFSVYKTQIFVAFYFFTMKFECV